jgi:UDP-N-acetylmuramoyl-L-alanyl-D-glutamate--2,6-diaminopimelate ligase
MARAAECQSDNIVITTDNPRSEDPTQIIEQILAGLDHPGKAVAIEDRAAAIAWAIGNAADDDVVLVAGKGHETFQEANGERVAISDYALARQALAARGGTQ